MILSDFTKIGITIVYAGLEFNIANTKFIFAGVGFTKVLNDA